MSERIHLGTVDGTHFLCVETDGRLVADRTAVGEYEQFTVEAHAGGVALKSITTGHYLSALDDAECDAHRLPRHSVTGTAPYADAWERWEAVRHGQGIALKSWLGLFLSPQHGGGGAVLADGPAPAGWEELIPSDFGPFGVIGGGDVRPGGPHPDPLQGHVRLVRGAFGDATGPRNVCSLHLGDLIGQGLVHGVDHILPALDFAAACGYHVVRSWWQLHTTSPTWWDNKPAPRWDPRSDRQRFAEILDAGAARGLKWHLAAGALKGLPLTEQQSQFDCLGDAIGQAGPEHFAMIEGANESRDTYDGGPADLERLVQRVRSRYPEILYGLTAFTGHEDRDVHREWTPSWQGFVIQHDYRAGRVHDKIRHLFSGAYEGELVRRNIWHGEPFGVGPGVSAQDNGHELTADAMALAGAMAVMTRGAWTFMSTPGVIYGRERLEDQPGIRETPALLRVMPQDVGAFPILGHSGPSKKGQRIHAVRDGSPDVREDYAINSDGRFVAMRYGPPEQNKDLQRERIYWDGDTLHQCSWGQVFIGRLS